MEIRNAIIRKARITRDDHGVLTAWLDLDYGGPCQGFGGYVLYLPNGCSHHSVWGMAGHFIYRVLQIADVESWEQLTGKTIRVKQDHSHVHAIGNIIKDDWFCPSEDFKDIEFKDVANAKNNWTNKEVDAVVCRWKEVADQWQAIAEKLAEYIDNMCYALNGLSCPDCPLYNRVNGCCNGVTKNNAIQITKNELGYE